VVCADGLTAEEADALLSVDGGGLPPESSDLFLSAISDESFTMSTQMRVMTPVPHEPRWLPTGCSGKS
jgi:hypothetical protein